MIRPSWRAVIAHEMGHVTANHGLQRQKLEAEEELATKVVSDVLGESPNAKAALIRGKLKLAQFSRNQELEADAIGIKTSGSAGYDPFAAARFLQSMAAYSDLRSVTGAADASLDFLASHPNAPQRIELAQRHARQFGAPGIGARDRDSFLAGSRRHAVRRHAGGGLCARHHLPASAARHLVRGAAGLRHRQLGCRGDCDPAPARSRSASTAWRSTGTFRLPTM